jgi:hypothetical protein
MGVEAKAREGELHHVGLAQDNGARLPQAPDDSRIPFGGRRIAQHQGSRRGGLARHIEQVLDRDDRPVEGSQGDARPSAPVGGVGRRPRGIRIEAQEHALVGCAGGQSRQDGFELVSDDRHGGHRWEG